MLDVVLAIPQFGALRTRLSSVGVLNAIVWVVVVVAVPPRMVRDTTSRLALQLVVLPVRWLPMIEWPSRLSIHAICLVVLRRVRLLLLLMVEVVILSILLVLWPVVVPVLVSIRLTTIIVLLVVAELVGACMLLVLHSIVLISSFPLRMLRHPRLLLAEIWLLPLVYRSIFEFVGRVALVLHVRVISGPAVLA